MLQLIKKIKTPLKRTKNWDLPLANQLCRILGKVILWTIIKWKKIL